MARGAVGGDVAEAKRLYRSRRQRVVAGVCGGIAEYFEVDPVLVRILLVVLIFFAGTGLVAYLVAWLIVPEAPPHPPPAQVAAEMPR